MDKLPSYYLTTDPRNPILLWTLDHPGEDVFPVQTTIQWPIIVDLSGRDFYTSFSEALVEGWKKRFPGAKFYSVSLCKFVMRLGDKQVFFTPESVCFRYYQDRQTLIVGKGPWRTIVEDWLKCDDPGKSPLCVSN